MTEKNKITIAVILIILLLLLTAGSTYAYFTANLEGGEEATTITVTGGSMNIIYSSGNNIEIYDIIPDNGPIESKRFTITGNNTTDIEMAYQVSLIVEENTFSEQALKYKLISTNTDNNGTVIPSVNELTNIGSGSNNIILGYGEYVVPTSGNKVHTYDLEIYFPNTEYSQNIDQEAVFKARIGIENYLPPCSQGDCLKDLIVAQEGGKAIIEAKNNPDYSVINTTNGIYSKEDEYGTSYYYRGERDLLLNNLLFAGFQWKILRVNGDGSVRIIYNGTEEEFNQNSSMNETGDSTQINITAWSQDNHDDNKYLGYMYGGLAGSASISRMQATTNETSSTIKNVLDIWYQNNILNNYNDYVADTLFCNNRQLQNEVGGDSTGSGYGDDTTYYAGYHALEINKNPKLLCTQKNDRFTVNDNAVGNSALTYPVGLITADEAAMSGLVHNLTNTENYLYTDYSYWTMTPVRIDWSYGEMFIISDAAHLSSINIDYSEVGIRPVLNLKFNTKVNGNGSADNPYRIK